MVSNEGLNRSVIDDSPRLRYPKRVLWECARCAKCCCDSTNHYRQILLLQSEANEITKACGLKVTDFCEPSDSGIYALRMKKNAGRCVFLDGVQCQIYDQRPLVCQFYPLWLRRNDGTYKFDITDECPGIGKGRPFDKNHYVSLLRLAQERLDVYET